MSESAAAPASGAEPSHSAPDRPARKRTPGGEFVGRHGEFSRLLQCLEDADAGHGGMVLVTGEPGIGKTKLLAEFADEALRRGAYVLSGRCLDGAGTVPYYAFAGAVRDFLAAGYDTTSIDLAAVAALVPDQELSAIDVPREVPLQPDELRMRLLDGMARFLTSLADAKTVAIVLDDLQWTDPSTAAMLQHVARTTRGRRIVLVGAYRSGEVSDSDPLSDVLAGARSETECVTVPLAGLDTTAMGEMLTGTAGTSLAVELIAEVTADTGGNPLFARETVRHLLEEGALRTDAEGLLRAERTQRPVPEGVRQVIARRRRRLSEAANQLLDAASVVNGPFPFQPVADVAGLSAAKALAGLDEALAAGLVGAEPEPDRYNFAHALMRNTIYTTLNPSRRLRLHRGMAEALEAACMAGVPITAAEIAIQYELSAVLPDAEKVVEAALQAAEVARAGGAHHEDARFLQLARRLVPPDDPRLPQVLRRSASALAWSLRFDESVDVAREALDATAHIDGAAAAVTAAADLAATFTAAGSNRHAWELAPRGLELAAATEQVSAVSTAVLTLLDLERSEAADPENPGIPLDVPERRTALRTLNDAGFLTGRADLGRYAVAAVYGTREQVPRKAVEDPTVALLLLGDFATALRGFEAESAIASDLGQLARELYARSSVARCHTALGDLSAAVNVMRLADDLAERIPGDRASWQFTTHLGAQDALAMALDGGWESILASTRPLLRPGRPEYQWAIATLSAAHGRAYARIGEAAAALPLLARAVKALSQAPVWAPNFLRTACDVAEALWLLDTQDLIADIEHALLRALDADFRFPMMDARLGLARLCALDGRYDEALDWFAKARTVLEAQSARTLRAIVDYDEALMHARRGDAAAARTPLLAAVDQFEALGMTGWVVRATEVRARFGL